MQRSAYVSFADIYYYYYYYKYYQHYGEYVCRRCKM